jgi:phage shock protein A
MALQQHTAQLIEKYDHISAEYAQLKAEHAQQKAEYAQQKADHEQLREMIMNMASQSGDTCAPHPFWPYNHQPLSPPAPPLY